MQSKNILVYNILYKSLIGSKTLFIRFNKIDTFVRVYDGTRYLALFGNEKMGLDIQHYLEMKKMIQFTAGIDILQV